MRTALLGGLMLVTAIACASPSPASVSVPPASSPAGVVCAGPEVDWSGLPAIVQAYGRAWNERDSAARLAYLEESVADDATYVDDTMERPAVGREAIHELIGTFHVGSDGHYFEPTLWADGDHHHDRYRMRWRLCDDAGQIVLAGEDIGVVGDDGRFVELVGFHE